MSQATPILTAGSSTSNPVSFDAFYAQTRTAAVRLASFLVASRAEAEELTQDVYVDLFQQWSRVENPGGLLRTLLVRRCSRSRSRGMREQRKLQFVGHRDDPYRLVPDEPELDETLAAVRRLGPEQRTVVVLRFYADMSHAQIADAVGCRIPTVRTRLHRALATLRRDMWRLPGQALDRRL